MRAAGRHLVRGLRSLIVPTVCPACDRRIEREGPLCSPCRGEILKLSRCAQDLPVIPGLLAPLCYEGVVRSLIHRMKYKGERTECLQLARWMRRVLRSETLPAGPVLLLPVPLHPVRLRERGFNQSERLAKAVGRPLRLVVRPDLLRRVRWVGPATSLDRDARREAVRGAFVCRRPHPGPATWVVVDDVWTTGATLEACREALLDAGVEGKILCLVAARTPEPKIRLRN